MNRFLGISTSGLKSRLVPSRCPWKRKCERPLATIRSERRTKNWKTRVNTFLLRKCGKVLINRFFYNVTVNDLINAQAPVPGKPISANRGLNLANRGINFIPPLDTVPESTININLGIN